MARQRTDRARLSRFLQELGHRLRRPVRFYLVGGTVLIALGLRAATLDIDYVADADEPEALAELEQIIRVLKNELDINVEPAGPSDFLPIPRRALELSPYVSRYGNLLVYYYHFPSLIIAKAARGFEQDLADIERLVRAGSVEWRDVEEWWREVRSQPTGWLRYEPGEVEQRLGLLRERLQTEDA